MNEAKAERRKKTVIEEESAREPGPDDAVHVTAALLRMLLNVKSLVWAAARDDRRSEFVVSDRMQRQKHGFFEASS
jgi:hypothetical protein